MTAGRRLYEVLASYEPTINSAPTPGRRSFIARREICLRDQTLNFIARLSEHTGPLALHRGFLAPYTRRSPSHRARDWRPDETRGIEAAYTEPRLRCARTPSDQWRPGWGAVRLTGLRSAGLPARQPTRAAAQLALGGSRSATETYGGTMEATRNVDGPQYRCMKLPDILAEFVYMRTHGSHVLSESRLDDVIESLKKSLPCMHEAHRRQLELFEALELLLTMLDTHPPKLIPSASLSFLLAPLVEKLGDSICQINMAIQ